MTPMIRQAAGTADFAVAAQFMAALQRLDVEGCAPYGIGPDEVAALYGDRSAATLAATFLRPDAAMFLAEIGGRPAGCGAFVRAAADLAELRHFYVDPAQRGAGIGAGLISTVLDEAAARGLTRARLETAVFLDSAIRLYKRHGFVECPPFRAIGPGIDGLSIFMRRDPG